MKWSAIEEQIVVKNEMQIFEDSVKEEHSLIKRQIEDIVQSNAHLSQFQQGCPNVPQAAILCVIIAKFLGLHHNICLPKLCLIGPDGTMCSKESLSVIYIDVDTNVSDIYRSRI